MTTLMIPKLKFLTVGDNNVGKSSLTNVFVFNSMEPQNSYYAGNDFLVRQLKIDERTMKILIWEIPRQSARFLAIYGAYCRRKDGILLVYDITSKESFDNLRNVWYQKEKDYTDANTQCILIGNKCDLESERKVESSMAKEFADNLKIPFMETSAKDHINVEIAFITLAVMTVRNIPNEVLDPTANCQLGGDRVVNPRSACYC